MALKEDARARLLEHFINNTSDQPDRWSKLWDKGDFLPWDRGSPNPALIDLLADKRDLIGTSWKININGEKQRKKALVPGCGRGYDVLLLASFGYDAFGLEVSEKAIELCIQEQETNGHKYPVIDESSGAGNVSFIKGDFFGNDWTKEVHGGVKFDLIYDYTFLCALPPSVRPSWALRHAQLLAPAPNGNLICLEFPTYKDPLTNGPPFGVRPETYIEHLSHPGENVPYDENGHAKGNVLEKANPEALERISHWQPKRSHPVGQGTDWISIWRHK